MNAVKFEQKDDLVAAYLSPLYSAIRVDALSCVNASAKSCAERIRSAE